MRSGVLALLLLVPFTALGQSSAARVVSPEFGRVEQATPQWTACSHLAPAISKACVSSQAASRNSIPSAFSFDSARPSYGFLAQSDPQPLFPPSLPSPKAKGEPIPTQWPNAKLEPIPTQWPHLSLTPIRSPRDSHAELQPAEK